jgi:hypothetical protein
VPDVGSLLVADPEGVAGHSRCWDVRGCACDCWVHLLVCSVCVRCGGNSSSLTLPSCMCWALLGVSDVGRQLVADPEGGAGHSRTAMPT